MRSTVVLSLLLSLEVAASTSSILFRGGTVVAFDRSTESLRVIRNGSVLVENDRVAGIFDSPPTGILPSVQVVDITDKIIAPGFVDTHRHGWQTAFKTIASNTSLVEYFGRYSEFVAGPFWTADDVYISQLAGLYESMNAGVTTTIDHAHHTWSNATAEAGLKACIDSQARVFWSYAFHNVTNLTTVEEQIPHFRHIASKGDFKGTPTSLGLAYDAWGPNPNLKEANALVSLAEEFGVSVITTHSLQGPWGITNSPEDINFLGFLNTSIPIVFSHASFLTAQDASLLRSTNQYVSITPESEMHYGHTHPKSYYIQDQAALGIDTHFTYSSDILTQARIWLQQARYTLYSDVLERWRVPSNSPETVNQAFLLATRHGGLALRREDLGVLEVGAKADLIVWDGAKPSLLGWVDPVAAIILHANVGDIDSVLVDGKFIKRNGSLVVEGYDSVKTRFLETAKRIQKIWRTLPLPDPGATFNGGLPIERAEEADTLRGPGDGYGQVFL